MPHSQQVLDIFAKLAALGVAPEQAAAGVMALQSVPTLAGLEVHVGAWWYSPEALDLLPTEAANGEGSK